MSYRNRIQLLRQQMAKNKIDIYLLFLSDEHSSEYVDEYYQQIAFLCGFTGSNAMVAVTMEEAGLWTDGRYFIQAKNEMAGSGVTLYKSGEENVETIYEFVEQHLNKGNTLAYYGRTVTVQKEKLFLNIIERKEAKKILDMDLMNLIWKKRPKRTAKPIYLLTEEYAGVSANAKINALYNAFTEAGADAHLLSNLCDIAWLLNLRGNDIESTPVFFSYFWLSAKERILYTQKESLSGEIEDYLSKLHVKIRDYELIYTDLKRKRISTVMLDDTIVNQSLYHAFLSKVSFLFQKNPTELMKAVKNEVEIKNTKKAHLWDAVAMCRFLYEVKNELKIEEYDEYTLSQHLLTLREAQPGFIEPSFETICAYGENAALMHYTATIEKSTPLEKKGFLLVDSGGHYKEGSTDITRTIVLGPITEEERHGFTLVLKASIRLMMARFPMGVSGENLDVLARGVMWQEGLDYRCGTGHGVGHILGVHEGPNSFRWRLKPNASMTPIIPGMITTDEPGLYEEHQFGIRTENELLCVIDDKTEYGQFLSFENLTLVPIDIEAIDISMLSDSELLFFNVFHAKVYEQVAPHLNTQEAKWLFEVTKPLVKDEKGN